MRSWMRRPSGNGAARAAEAAGVRADAERPAPERALDPGLALDPVEHARMDLLVDARHRGKDGRPDGAERLGDARRVGDERDRRAVVRRRLVRESAEGVRERQEEQDGVAAVLEVRAHVDRGGDEVLVREHAALRRPRRAGGVDERSEIVLLDLARGRVERVRMLGRVRATLGLELGSCAKVTISRSAGSSSLDGAKLLALRVVFGEREHRLRVREDVRRLARGVRRIDADDDGADVHDRPVEEDPLDPGAREDGDRVAASHAAREEGVRQGLDPAGRFLPGDLAPARLLLLEVRGRRPALVEHVAPEGRGGAGLEGRVGPGQTETRWPQIHRTQEGNPSEERKTPVPLQFRGRSCGRSGTAQSASAWSTSQSGWPWRPSGPMSRSGRCIASAARRSSRSGGARSTSARSSRTSS